MSTGHIERLFNHLWWADDRVISMLEAVTTVPEKAVSLYAHVLGAELVWLDRIEQVAQRVPVWPDVDIQGCTALARRAKQGYETLLRRLDGRASSALVHYTNTAGTAFATPLDDILLHVCLHGAYHRGQIAQLVRGAGGQPAVTDYIAFVRSEAAERR